MEPITLPEEFQAVLDDAAREVQTAVALAGELAAKAEQARQNAERKIHELEGSTRTILKLNKLNPDGHTIEYDDKADKAVVRPKEQPAPAPEPAPKG